MTTIPVYKIDTAKGKLPKKAEVEGDQNIENGFAYARGLSKDRQNYNYYAVTEDDESKLFQIGDHVVSKEGTFLFLPFQDLKTCMEENDVIKVKALAALPPPTQVNPL